MKPQGRKERNRMDAALEQKVKGTEQKELAFGIKQGDSGN
jgi:hypothetical protein